MKLRRIVVAVCAVALSLAGCGRESALAPTPSLVAPAIFYCQSPAAKIIHGAGTVFELTTSGSLKVLHRFGGSGDGANPAGGLLELNGTLYGTTESGGANGQGTVFAITSAGVESVLHSFGGSGDGSTPLARLISVGGTLYGTTEFGGAYGCGTVFSISTSGTETVLHSFGGYSSDGAWPASKLLDVKGTLYGTTPFGGAGDCGSNAMRPLTGTPWGCGAVFKITTSGKESVIHSFGGSSGWHPDAGLINVNGTFYGTTVWNTIPHPGTIFKITPSGDEDTFYYFGGAPDGASPYAGLINVNGTLYGTTHEGGNAGGSVCRVKGCGTVFSITTSGKEKIVYSFKTAAQDGKHPYADLVNVKGTLYGTTYAGGTTGRGTVFAVTTSGTEKVIYTFGRGSSTGKSPYGGLIDVKGKLYGTTMYGGN